MTNDSVPFEQSSTLDQALVIMEQMALWLIRSGVGYTDFAAALKPIFFQQALKESARIEGKQTDSALSLLSGLHRRDVSVLREGLLHADIATRPLLRATATSVPAQVIGSWLAQDWPNQIPLTGEAPSFEALVKNISKDMHPRAIQHELERLQVVSANKEHISLQQRAFIPDPQALETRQMVSHAVADHLAAGVHNLTSGSAEKFLEQSVFADGLTVASIEQLQQMSRELWQDAMSILLKLAVERCKQDQDAEGNTQRFRMGIFSYAHPED